MTTKANDNSFYHHRRTPSSRSLQQTIRLEKSSNQRPSSGDGMSSPDYVAKYPRWCALRDKVEAFWLEEAKRKYIVFDA